MKLRVIAVCTLLLLTAVPSFALPLCAECTEWNTCESLPGSFERCRYTTTGSCYTTFERCSIPFQGTVLAEWTVASIEISRPSQESVTVTAPAAVTEVPAPAATHHATELK
jgi:hypothetical protein